MKVGDSIRLAIDDWERGEAESAIMHACNAVDGTAKKSLPTIAQNKERFTTFLRTNYAILGPMGAPGIDVVATRWPVTIPKPTAPGGKPDLADVIYVIHRCTHGHGDELPEGFELLLDADASHLITRIEATKGRVRLSDRVIFALVAVAVMAPVNVGQVVPDGYHLTFGGREFPINDWWGKASEFVQIVGEARLPSVKMDFGDWIA